MTAPNEDAGLPPVTPPTGGGEGETEYKYDIMRIIERKNLEEVQPAKVIVEFESKVK